MWKDLPRSSTNSSIPNSESGLFLYVDLHAHASSTGVFMYGNFFENMDDQIECMLLPKLMAINCPNFHFNSCVFTEQNMYRSSKDKSDVALKGCGRVAVSDATGLIRSYTLECNYNTGRIVNPLPFRAKDPWDSPPRRFTMPPRYTPRIYEEVGQALAVSILDLTGSNPYTRVPNSDHRSLSGMRLWLKNNVALENMLLYRRIKYRRSSLSPRRRRVSIVHPLEDEEEEAEARSDLLWWLRLSRTIFIWVFLFFFLLMITLKTFPKAMKFVPKGFPIPVFANYTLSFKLAHKDRTW